MKGGYTMIDCKGLNLQIETAQTISGIYAACKTAIATEKPVFAYNIIFGTNNKMTPIPVMVNFESAESEYIVATASTVQIWVTKADSVTVRNMLATAKATRTTAK